MKSQIVLAVILMGAFLVLMVVGEEGKKGKWEGMGRNMTCKGEQIKKGQMSKGSKECMEEMKGTTEEATTTEASSDKKGKKHHHHKYLCFEVCKLKKQGILNADGDYDSAGADNQIKATFPESAQADLKSEMDTCAAKIGDKATRMDNNCEGYAKFKKCNFDSYIKVCDLEEQLKEMKKKHAEKDDNN